jgi:hypothetical protein
MGGQYALLTEISGDGRMMMSIVGRLKPAIFEVS